MTDSALPTEPPVPEGPRGKRWRVAVAVVVVAVGLGAVATLAEQHSLPTLPISMAGSAATPSASPSAHPGRHFDFPGRRGGAMGGFGFGHGGGATGTVTSVSGSTLTLRTLTGTVQVTTTSTTQYMRELHTIMLSGIHANDVVMVRGTGTPPAGKPLTSIAATAITVRVPSISGRVQSVTGNAITIVTADGQLNDITTSSSTMYATMGGRTAATGSAVTAGVFITAAGTWTDLTHLTADDISINSGMGPHAMAPNAMAPMGSPPGGGGGPGV